MNRVLFLFTGLALILVLVFCTSLTVSASYTKYVREGDSLKLECISDFNNSWTIMWLCATTYWRPTGKLLSKNDLLHDQNIDNRFSIDVHQITSTRKRYPLTITNVKRSEDAVYWCVALPNLNAVHIEAINNQATDLTGDIYVTVEYHPGPEDPICLTEATANYQTTLICCHGLTTPFPTRKLLMNERELNNTQSTRNGKLYCLAANVNAAEETYWCELTSAAFPCYKSTCKYNLQTLGPSPSNDLLPESVTEANYHNVTDIPGEQKLSTLSTTTKHHTRSPTCTVLIIIIIIGFILICLMILFICICHRNKCGSILQLPWKCQQ